MFATHLMANQIGPVRKQLISAIMVHGPLSPKYPDAKIRLAVSSRQ